MRWDQPVSLYFMFSGKVNGFRRQTDRRRQHNETAKDFNSTWRVLRPQLPRDAFRQIRERSSLSGVFDLSFNPRSDLFLPSPFSHFLPSHSLLPSFIYLFPHLKSSFLRALPFILSPFPGSIPSSRFLLLFVSYSIFSPNLWVFAPLLTADSLTLLVHASIPGVQAFS